jgi:hypothetical protein
VAGGWGRGGPEWVPSDGGNFLDDDEVDKRLEGADWGGLCGILRRDLIEYVRAGRTVEEYKNRPIVLSKDDIDVGDSFDEDSENEDLPYDICDWPLEEEEVASTTSTGAKKGISTKHKIDDSME